MAELLHTGAVYLVLIHLALSHSSELSVKRKGAHFLEGAYNFLDLFRTLGAENEMIGKAQRLILSVAHISVSGV